MVWGDGQAQRAYITDSMTRIHHEIETMTRRLELEKRRLHRIEKELLAARKTYDIRVVGSTSKPPVSDPKRPSIARSNAMAPLPSMRDGQSRPYSAREEEREKEEFDVLPCNGFSNSIAVAGPVKALLNRLEAQTKKLDYMNQENIELRNEVDTIRRRRLQLNSIFDKLKFEIRQRTEQLSDFVEETAASRAVHENAGNRVSVMKKRRDFERRQFKQEVMRLREQLKLQEWERKEVEVQLKRADTNVQKKKELIIPEEENSFSEGDMMRRIMKTAFLNCIQRRHIKQHQKSIEVYEQAFATIKSTTGIEHIEEIVKIFVNLESRNYSLLTYVNVMNREIEALEGVRRERRQDELTQQRKEEQEERARNHALADIQHQLQISQRGYFDSHESLRAHSDILSDMMPILLDITRRIESEFENLRNAGASGHVGDELLKLPTEFREDTLPEWLEWVETALGRFRDVLPGEKDAAFPCTAHGQVKHLVPKRLGGHAPPQQLVKTQELPSAISLVVDESGNPTSKRVHAGWTAAQKAELLDEESEEEDFEKNPLDFKDLRLRAEQSAYRRRKRGKDNKREGHTVTYTVGKANCRARQTSQSSSLEGATESMMLRSFAARPVEPTVAQKEGEADDEDKSDTGTDWKTDVASVATDAMLPTLSDAATMKVDVCIEDSTPKSAQRKVRRGGRAWQVYDQEPTEVSEEVINACFLRRYKMTRGDLQAMADHLNFHTSHLCSLKQEFDSFDPDQSGYIDTRELKKLLKKLGEELHEEALNKAIKELDGDASGEIEFFEFAQWFTHPD